MRGSASLSFMSRLVTVRQPRTTEICLRSPSRASVSSATARRDTNANDDGPRAPPSAPNIRRRYAGCGVGVAHLRPRHEPALEHELGPDAEAGRPPHDEVRPLAHLDGADLVGKTVRQRRVDRVLGDVAADARVVVEPAALELHLVCGLPG